MEKVSAIITTHNRLDYLKRAIESVKKQTYKNIELIIVDDASNDGTYNYCKGLCNIKYIYIDKKDSKGGNYARNLGIDNATGKYIAFLDDDDEWFNDKIEKQINKFKLNNKLGVVYCARRFIINNGIYSFEEKINGENIGDCSKKILYNIIGVTSTLLIKKEILNKEKFDEKLKFWQEYDLMIRICQNYEIDFIDEPLIYYSINLSDKNRLTNKFDGWLKNVDYINKKYKKLINKLSEEEKNMRNIMIYYDAANRCSSIGDKDKKKKYLKKIYHCNKTKKNYIKYLFNIERNDVIKIKLFFNKFIKKI